MDYFSQKDESGTIIPASRSDIPGNGGPACKCSVCNEVFSTPDNFDKHRELVNRRNYRRECRDPATVGLVLGKYNTWVTEQAWFNDENDSAP